MSAPAPGGSPSPPSPRAPGPTSRAVPAGPPLPPMMPPGPPPPSSSPPQPPVTPAASPPKPDQPGLPKSPLPQVHPADPPASSPHPQPPVAMPPASSPPTAATMPTPSPPPVTPAPSPPSPSPQVMPVPPTPSSSPPVTPPPSPSPPVTPQPPTPSPSPPSPVTPQPPTLPPPSPVTPQPPTPFPPSPSTPSQPPPAAPAPTTPPAPPLPPGSPPTTPSPSPPKPSRSPPSTAPFPPTPTPPDSTPSPPGGFPPSPPSTSPPSLLPPSLSSPSSSSPASSSSPSTQSRAVIGITAAVAAVVVIGLVAGLFYCSRKSRRRPPPPPGDLHGHRLPVTSQQQSHTLASPFTSTPPPMYAPPQQQQAYSPWQSSGGGGAGGSDVPTPPPPPVTGGTLSYADLDAATGGFSEGNLLGQGGFGHVYRGTLRGGREEVAIKKLRPGSGQGDREFHAEVEIISRVHHRNLVSLVGYCIYGDHRLLVYEYVPNKTLEFHLHGSGRPTLDWPRRWKIAVGAAKGLAYLHEDCRPKIIHRDIKAANILLDYNFEPKVADFGLAKIQPGDYTHVSTRVMGTFGYLAPEYATTGKVNDRSDVFSLGVVLLELITGRRPVLSTDDEPYNDETLVSWARPLLTKALEEHVVDELIDPRLDENYDAHDMKRLIACAAGAVRHTARSRPRMSQVVRYLEGELSMEDLNAGVAPGQSLLHLHEHSGDTTEQMKRIRRMAFVPGTGTENVSSDYLSEMTSEYGLYPSSSSSGGYTGDVSTRPVTSQPHADTPEGAAQHSGVVTSTADAMSRRPRPPGRAGR